MSSGTPLDNERDANARASRLLRSLGWQYLTSTEELAFRGGRRNEVLLRGVLEKQLQALNSFEHQGRWHSPSKQSIDAAVQALQLSTQEEISHANEKVWSLLKTGAPVREVLDGNTRSLTLRYVDWDQPENNSYHLVEEFRVAGPSGNRTPDYVLFVNGIPFVVIEVKSMRPGVDSKRQIHEAISKLQSYQHAQHIPQLFHYTQLLLAVSAKSAAYGVVGAEREHWPEWQETGQPPSTDDIPPIVNEQDRLLYALCYPRRLLDLVRWFTSFHYGRRIVARHHQYAAVQAVLAQVSKPQIDGRRPGGVVWHMQGSGKTSTIGMLARVLLDVFAERKARVLVVSDRGALDDQLYERLKSVGINCRQAVTGRELRHLLSDPQVRVITTAIQKFGTAANTDELVSDSPDLFVLVDEAHRTQTGSLAQAMRWMLPRACLIGFTGTPIFRTLAAFGPIIAQYTFEQAIADRTLLPLYWEDRSAGIARQVDYDSVLPADLLIHAKPLENLARIGAIAEDLAAHFTKHFSDSPLKGVVVAPSRESAVLFKHILDRIGTVRSEVVISLEDRDYSEAGPLCEFRREIVQKFGSEARYVDDVLWRYSENEDPKLLIVVDRLLADMDVPKTAALYITRPLSGHVLMQAIARTNRPYVGKTHGLIVDYVGLGGELTQLASAYGSNLGIRSAGASIGSLWKPTIAETIENYHVETQSPKGMPPSRLELLCEEILHQTLESARRSIPLEVIQSVAAKIAGAIDSRRKVDWISDPDIQNQMKTAIEDILFDTQAEEGVPLPLTSIDAIMDSCVESARNITP